MVHGLSVGKENDMGEFITNFGTAGLAFAKADRRGGILRNAHRDVADA